MEHIIEVKGLKKRYGQVEAVKGIDFYVEKGKMFAFLGPNGAGKSTTIDILCTLLAADAGDIQIGGMTIGKANDAIRRQIGIVFQDSVLDRLLTVKENLTSRAQFYGLDAKAQQTAIRSAIEAADIDSFLDRRYGKLSGGQRRRADIARALINTPELLFLDEPTTGLDPQTRRSVWNTIYDIQKSRGMTVFFSTHYMEEAARADYIIIIDAGEIAARGTPQQLKERYAQDTLRLIGKDSAALQTWLAERSRAFTLHEGDVLYVPVDTMEESLGLLNEAAPLLADFEVVHGTMDDVFIKITGEKVREG